MTRKIMIYEPDQLRFMLLILEAHEANVARDYEACYNATRTLLNMFFISEEVRKEAYRRHSEEMASKKKKKDEDLANKLKELAGGYDNTTPTIPATIELDDPTDEDAETPVESLNLPTQKIKKALRRFTELTDDQQVDHLRGLWGDV